MHNKYKVLILEDEAEILGFAVRKLKREGYEVFGASNIKMAREFAEKNEFDLFVLDVMLPDGSGYDFCKELRQNTSTPVLFLTGKTQIDDKVEGIQAGCDYYLTKPYDYKEFVAIVKSLILRNKKDHKTKLKIGPLLLDFEQMDAFSGEEQLFLTRKEFSLLLILAENVNEPIKAETLYEKVWNSPMNDNNGALWAQLSRLRKKIEKIDALDLVNDRKQGYYLEYKEY